MREREFSVVVGDDDDEQNCFFSFLVARWPKLRLRASLREGTKRRTYPYACKDDKEQATRTRESEGEVRQKEKKKVSSSSSSSKPLQPVQRPRRHLRMGLGWRRLRREEEEELLLLLLEEEEEEEDLRRALEARGCPRESESRPQPPSPPPQRRRRRRRQRRRPLLSPPRPLQLLPPPPPQGPQGTGRLPPRPRRSRSRGLAAS